MPKHLQKSIQDYLSKIKKRPISHIHLRSRILSSSHSTGNLLRGCRHHPKTPSFAVVAAADGKNTHDSAATLADIDRFLFENFRSLYLKDDDDDDDDHNADDQDKKKKGDKDGEEKSDGILFGSPRFIDPPPDLCGSHRFFVTTGSSSSLMEESRTSATVSEDTVSSFTTATAATATKGSTTRIGEGDGKKAMGPDDFIAVFTCSPNPYEDFRNSMQEMIEARVYHHGKVDWGFMEELLFCYLNLNEKKSYKHIISAFVDLIVVLRASSGEVPVRSRRVQSVGNRRKQRVNVM
ncbi:hypothetical protein U1Q18_026974 [Sarracenia purpurea var. burkii]